MERAAGERKRSPPFCVEKSVQNLPGVVQSISRRRCKNADAGSNKADLASKKRTNSGRKSDKEAKDDSVNKSESGPENNGGAPDAE